MPKATSKAKSKAAVTTAPAFNLRPLLITALISLVLAWFAWPRHSEHMLHTYGQTYDLELVTKPHAMIKGLGGRTSLPRDKGMLFAYEQSAPNRCFWMKDMRFAIDILWFDSAKTVVHVEQNVTPKTYPKEFCAPESSQYVIELNAGEATRAGITLGQTLRF